jgi:hypothetical protein
MSHNNTSHQQVNTSNQSRLKQFQNPMVINPMKQMMQTPNSNKKTPSHAMRQEHIANVQSSSSE